jgi:hypothetical protein
MVGNLPDWSPVAFAAKRPEVEPDEPDDDDDADTEADDMPYAGMTEEDVSAYAAEEVADRIDEEQEAQPVRRKRRRKQEDVAQEAV